MGGNDDRFSVPTATDAVNRTTLTGAEVSVIAATGPAIIVPIGPTGLWIGSGSDCDVRLDDRRVSRRHLELRAEPNGIRLLDATSRNGTYVGPLRVRDVLLEEDTILRAGNTTLHVRLLDKKLEVDLSLRAAFGEAVARSAAMRHVFSLLERAAKNDVTVLIEGDSGTGKDVLARALHRESARSGGPFVVVDCGAIAEHLVESELFGHEKGAFTGATATHEGAFEQADGGTVFLDEVGELSLDAQPKLLRALENRSFRRVGGKKTVEVDVRLVAATNRRLRDAVRRGEFREDLYYRLSVIHVAVPRLAERPDDVPLLAEVFLRRATRNPEATVPPDLLRLLAAYEWPGNARELRNVIERFATFDRADPVLLFGQERGDAPPIALAALDEVSYHEAKQRLIDEYHRIVLPRIVERAGSVPRAAEVLGIAKTSLYRILDKLGKASDSG